MFGQRMQSGWRWPVRWGEPARELVVAFVEHVAEQAGQMVRCAGRSRSCRGGWGQSSRNSSMPPSSDAPSRALSGVVWRAKPTSARCANPAASLAIRARRARWRAQGASIGRFV